MSIKNIDGRELYYLTEYQKCRIVRQVKEDEKKSAQLVNQPNKEQMELKSDLGKEGVYYENEYNARNDQEENQHDNDELEIHSEDELEDKKYPFMCLSEVVKMPRVIKKNKKIVFNVTETIYRVIKNQGSNTMGWTTITSAPSNREDWNISWCDTYISEEVLRRLLPYQKINHFPGSYHLGKKNYLAQNLTKMRKVLENEYSFFPRTWTLPLQFEEFKRYNENIKSKKPYYIVKPESSCQGRGIYLTKKIESFSYNDHCVIQEYIKNPFLIDSLKFDFRIYVLIKNINPLKVFMYPDGLARFATIKYQKPNKKNCQNFTMHLTNYAVNKKSPNFVFNENEQNDDVGHKRSFSSVLKQLHNMGKNIPKLYMEIRQLIVKSIISVQPQLSHIYRSSQPKEYNNEMCFEILGFDVMIDEKMKPWLLEVNHSASFHCDSPLDSSIKKHVILDTLNILNVSSKEKKKYLDMKSQAQFAYRKKDQAKTAAEQDQNKIDEQKIIKFENKHKGAFIRIYPAEDDPCDYEKILKVANTGWNESVSPKKNAQAQNVSSTAVNRSDQKNNIKITPVKKPTQSTESNSVLNTTQISQAKSDTKQKLPNQTKKNLSQVFDDSKDKASDNFLNFLPNLQKENNNSTLKKKLSMLGDQNSNENLQQNLSKVNIKSEVVKSNESQIIMNWYTQDDYEQMKGEGDKEDEDILSNIVAKKRSMTQIDQEIKIRQEQSHSHLFHASSFQLPSNQMNSAKLQQPTLQDISQGTKTSAGTYFENSQTMVSTQQTNQQQNTIFHSMINNLQNPQSSNEQPHFTRNNNFNPKSNYNMLDAFSEDGIQLKNKGNHFHEQKYNIMQQNILPQSSHQQSSLEYQKKLNIINLGINSPDQVINETWYSQTQKPLYLRSSARKPYKTQLRPLPSDFQQVMSRDNRSSNSNKLHQQSIQNDSLLQQGPKYICVRKNNIPNKYSSYSHQQNIDNFKQIDYNIADQIISRVHNNNSMPSKSNHNQPSPHIHNHNHINNNNNNNNNFPSVSQQNQQQLNITQMNSNGQYQISNGSVNSMNNKVSANQNKNGKDIIGVDQEVQMAYSKRRIVRKSIERKQVKDIILNQHIHPNYRDDQNSQQSIKLVAQIGNNQSSTLHKTNDSMDQLHYAYNTSSNADGQTIAAGLLNNNNNTIPGTSLLSPQNQKQIDFQNILNLRNQEQPILISPNLIGYQSSQSQHNQFHIQTSELKSFSKNQIVPHNQIIIQNNKHQYQPLAKK